MNRTYAAVTIAVLLAVVGGAIAMASHSATKAGTPIIATNAYLDKQNTVAAQEIKLVQPAQDELGKGAPVAAHLLAAAQAESSFATTMAAASPPPALEAGNQQFIQAYRLRAKAFREAAGLVTGAASLSQAQVGVRGKAVFAELAAATKLYDTALAGARQHGIASK